MFRPGFAMRAAVCALTLGSLSLPAAADGMKTADKLSRALCGSLDDGMIAADGAGHGRIDTTAPLRAGRSEEYRRRVAREASQSHLATSAH